MLTNGERSARTSLIVGFILVSAACSSSETATTGKRITLHTRFAPAPDVADEFVTSTKWRVRLDAAALAVAGLYYFDGQPAFVRLERSRPERTPFERLRSLFIGTAYAHPQHYVAGNALGEMVEPTSLDLFEAAELPAGEGVTGTFRSGRLVLASSSVGPAADVLGEHVAVARGVATKDDETVYFRLVAKISDIQQTSPAAEVDGCVFAEATVEVDGTVTLTATPRVWLNLVDFSGIEGGSPDQPTSITADQTAHRAFALGVAQLSAYHFAYTP